MKTELADRTNDGIRVVLLWHRETGELTVEVFDEAGGDFTLRIEAAEALDAFHHPYAYASRRGIRHDAGTREPSRV